MVKNIFLVVILAVMALACKKDNPEIIPNVQFYAEVNLDDPMYTGLNPFIVKPGGLNRIVGVNGVVVFEAGIEYWAFDLMCTHTHENGAIVFVEFMEDGGITMECPKCKSQFNVASEYGSVNKGPAVWALKRYQTSETNRNLTIWN